MSMFIGQGLSLEARRATQAERRAANTATAAASEAAAAAANSMAAAAADSMAAAAALTKWASSASRPFFALSPPAKMDSIAPPLVYAEDFYLEHNRSVRALVVLCHGLTHDDGTPAIKEHPLSNQCRRLAYLQRMLSDGDDDDPHDGIGAPLLRSAGAMQGGGVMVVLRPTPSLSSSC